MISNKKKKQLRRLFLQYVFACEWGLIPMWDAFLNVLKEEEQYKPDPLIESCLQTFYVRYITEQARLQTLIEKYLQNWTYERLRKVDASILKILIVEYLEGGVSKDELLKDSAHIAREFSTDKSPPFVQGVLNQILSEL